MITKETGLQNDFIYAYKAANVSNVSPSNSEAFSLCIYLDEFQFAYSVSDKENKIYCIKVVRLKGEGRSELEKLINTDEWLNVSYLKILVLFHSSQFTLVPAAFFLELEIDSYLRLNHNLNENDITLSDTILGAQSKIIYRMDKEIVQLINTLFPNHHKRNIQAVMIEQTANQGLQGFLNVKEKRVDFCFKTNGKLLFLNTFNWNAPEDVAYYVLNSVQQFGLNAEEMQLHMAGEVATQNPLFVLLKTYFPLLSLPISDKWVKKEGDLLNLPGHYYYFLLSGFHCE